MLDPDTSQSSYLTKLMSLGTYANDCPFTCGFLNSTRILSGLLCVTVMSVWIVRSQYNSTFQFSTLSTGACNTCKTFLSFPVHASCTISNVLFRNHCQVRCFCASLGQPLTRCITVSSFIPHNLHLRVTGCLMHWLLVPAPEMQIPIFLFKNPFLIDLSETCVQGFWFSLQIDLVTFLHAKSSFFQPF